MTVLLVLSTLILFLSVDYVIQRRKGAAAGEKADSLSNAIEERALPLTFRLPSGVDLAPNHTWMRRDGRGLVRIGFDEMVSGLVGAVQEVLVPGVGSGVEPATGEIVLRDGTRSLRLAIPMGGRVVSVNHGVLRRPSIAGDDPYGRGWLLEIRPDGDRGPLLETYTGGRAIEWLKEQARLARELLGSAMPQEAFAAMQDGGMPVHGILKKCDTDVWNDFQESFFALRAAEVQRGE